MGPVLWHPTTGISRMPSESSVIEIADAPAGASRARAWLVAISAALAATATGMAIRVALAPIDISVGPLRIRARDPQEAAAFAGGFLVLFLLVYGRMRAARWLVAAGAAVLAALALTAIAVRAPHGLPVGDAALLQSYTLLTTRGELLLGPYSRFAWHHPGPMYFWLLAPFYALAGYDTPGLHVGAFLINVLSVVCLVWTVRRSTGGMFALVLIGSIAAYVWRAREVMVSAWNPHVTVLAAAALAPLAAATAAGDLALLPLVAVCATFIVQTHIGFAPYAAALSACAAAGLWTARAGGAGGWSRVKALLNRTAWLLVVLWSFPIADQLTRTPGNVTRLLRFFLVEDRGGQPAGTALRAWADAATSALRPGFHLPTGVLFVPTTSALVVTWGVAQLALLAACAVWWARRQRRFEAWLSAVLAIASVVTCASVLRIAENLVDHELYWMSAIGFLSAGVFVAAAATIATGADGRRRVSRRIVTMACAVPIALAIASGVRGLSGPGGLPFGVRNDDRIVRTLTDGVRRHLQQSGAQKPLVRMDVTTWGYAAGVVLQLERAAVPVAVEDGDVPLFSDAVAVDGREAVELTIARQPKQAALASRPGNIVVAATDGLFIDALPITPNPNR